MIQRSDKANNIIHSERVDVGNPRRIAVFRALHLGDLLLAVPALRAIRTQFPHAEITLIGLPWAASFAHRFSRYIDRFVEFAGYPGIAEIEFDAERTREFLVEQRAYSYDLVIQMHGNGQTSNACVQAMGSRMTVGYYPKTCQMETTTNVGAALARPPVPLKISSTEQTGGGRAKAAPMLAMPYPDEAHEIERNLGLARLTGCHNLDPRLEFPLLGEDYAEAARLLYRLPRADRLWIGIHAGARSPAQRWPVEYFACIADILANHFHAQVILTGGHAEKATVQAVAQRMKSPYLNLAGATSLGGLAAIISELDLFISNDTGPAHIANAVDTPGITIFGPVDPKRWAALDQLRHPFVRHPVACSPCTYWECPIDHRCLRRLSPEMVIAPAEKLLAGGESRAEW